MAFILEIQKLDLEANEQILIVFYQQKVIVGLTSSAVEAGYYYAGATSIGDEGITLEPSAIVLFCFGKWGGEGDRMQMHSTIRATARSMRESVS